MSERTERLAAWLKRTISPPTTLAYANQCKACKEDFTGVGDLCRQCLRVIADRLESDGWKDIATAPKDGTKIVIAEYDDYSERWLFREDYWRTYASDYGEGFGSIMRPTHWRPLPPPPAEKGAE